MHRIPTLVKLLMALLASAVVACRHSTPAGSPDEPAEWSDEYRFHIITADTALCRQQMDFARAHIDSARAEAADRAQTALADYLTAWHAFLSRNEPQAIAAADRALAFAGTEAGTDLAWSVHELLMIKGCSYLKTHPDSTLYYLKLNQLEQRKMGIDIAPGLADTDTDCDRNGIRVRYTRHGLDRCHGYAHAMTDNLWREFVWTNMAYSYAMMGNLDKADRSLGKASFLLDTTDDEYFKSIYWLARAMISVLEKSYDEAVDYAQNVTNEHKDPGLAYYHGMANYLTAKCFLIKGEIGVATHYLGKSIDIISADTTDSQLDNIREEQTLTMNIIRSRRRPELIDSIANRSHLSQNGRDLVRAALINAHQNNYYHDIFTTVNPGSLGFGWTQTDTYRSQIIDLQFSLDSLRRVSGTPMCTHGNGGGSSAIAIAVAIVAVVAAVLTTVVARVRLRRIRHDYDSRIKIALNDQTHLIDIQREKLNQTAGRIEDSIRYAEKIQHAMLPPPEDLNLCHIDGSFIFFNPLDIVSGDFYWFRQNGNKLLVCCADCTGHGVPGAFMSMIASTMIGEIFDKIPDCTPALMLEELDRRIIKTVGHNSALNGMHDGLDASVALIDTDTKLTMVASARRPVFIMRDETMIEITGTRRSIGETEPEFRQRQFENETYQLHADDSIYMYTDGYSDQFGGMNSEKLKKGRIKKLIRSMHNDDIDAQGLTIQELFVQWKGDMPQTDDVLFMGIRL